jgi:hypothetical protein
VVGWSNSMTGRSPLFSRLFGRVGSSPGMCNVFYRRFCSRKGMPNLRPLRPFAAIRPPGRECSTASMVRLIVAGYPQAVAGQHLSVPSSSPTWMADDRLTGPTSRAHSRLVHAWAHSGLH